MSRELRLAQMFPDQPGSKLYQPAITQANTDQPKLVDLFVPKHRADREHVAHSWRYAARVFVREEAWRTRRPPQHRTPSPSQPVRSYE